MRSIVAGDQAVFFTLHVAMGKADFLADRATYHVPFQERRIGSANGGHVNLAAPAGVHQDGRDILQ